MPHVELSLTDLPPTPPPARDPLGCWATAVATAAEPCLVIDADECIVAISSSCADLLGLTESPVGRPLRGGTLRLIDFSSQGGELTETEVGKIPPLLSLSSGRLARGLIRVEHAGSAHTLDAIATPIGESGAIAGSLTFFSPV